jgi:hypothetical protein
LLKRALADPALARAAQAFASSHAGYDQTATVELAVARCQALLQAAP